jgi:hypothetical protein
MQMTKVVSSNIDSIGYNEETCELFVKFKNNKVFCYKEVSGEEARALKKSASVGRHFNQYIKAVKVVLEVKDFVEDVHEVDLVTKQAADIKMLRDAVENLVKSGCDFMNAEDLEDEEDQATMQSNFNDSLIKAEKALAATNQDKE